MEEILAKIENNEAEFIGEGEWYKDSAYQVYKVDNKFYAIVVYDSQSCWLMGESLQEISQEEISEYI